MFKLSRKFRFTSDKEDKDETDTLNSGVQSLNLEKNNTGSNGSDSGSSTANTSMTATTTGATASTGNSISNGTPGLLTFKIYTSNNLSVPANIRNDKEVLVALANNSNTTKLALLDKISQLDNSEFLDVNKNGEVLPCNFVVPAGTKGDKGDRAFIYMTIEFENNVIIVEPQNGTIDKCVWNQVISFDVSRSINSTVNLNVYAQLPKILVGDDERILIGKTQLKLDLNHNKSVRLLNHENVDILCGDKTTNKGQIILSIDYKPKVQHPLTIEDFDLLKVIGKGSFGKVMQVVKKDTKQIYALKTIRKQHIISRMEVTHTLAERTVLAKINNPFIVPLKFCFQSPEKLYFVLSFINGGELFFHLQKDVKFSMDRSRFYISELLSALESLHELNVIYRDLKPENILLDYQGHIALCDFGLCKLNMANDGKTNTFCGTPEYLAPELILNQSYTRSVDWWTLGTLLYEMLEGLPPFYDNNHTTMYTRILKDTLKFPSYLENTDAADLITQLLQKDPSKRLDDPAKIKSHRFFKDIDWQKLLNKSYTPPFVPRVNGLLDTSNFDPEFTKEKPMDSVVDDFLSESVQRQFGGWTYNGDKVL